MVIFKAKLQPKTRAWSTGRGINALNDWLGVSARCMFSAHSKNICRKTMKYGDKTSHSTIRRFQPPFWLFVTFIVCVIVIKTGTGPLSSVPCRLGLGCLRGDQQRRVVVSNDRYFEDDASA